MDYMPEEVVDKIYRYKHQLEYKSVMNELILHRLNTAFNMTLDMVEMMLYYDHNGCARKVINIDKLLVKKIQSENITFNSNC